MTAMNEATLAQIKAADPARSTWLTANAGSGKTRVLTDRVARLLLHGVDPQNILCLTYTKAAASEMQNRLFRRLGGWSMLDDTALSTELGELGEPGPHRAKDLAHARTLFAKAVETPGGIKIQTIHSFCSALLRRFPLEAGVSPAFKEMDERDAELLRAEVLDQIIELGSAPLVRGVLHHLDDQRLGKFTEEVVKHRDALLAGHGLADIGALFGLGPDAQASDAIGIAFTGGETGLAAEIVSATRNLAATFVSFAQALVALNLDAPQMADLEALFGLLLNGTPKTSRASKFPAANASQATRDAFAPVLDDLHAWMDRAEAAHQHLLAVSARDRTHALYRFAEAFIPAYESAKLARGLLDFDDLIRKARDLLSRDGVAQWILYKLDGGIDHILVDEAQDTSPAQWDVVRILTEEFESGLGSRSDHLRTVFVVGDKKQSIYSFQGADPEGLERMRVHFSDALDSIGLSLQIQPLQFSFRSSPAIMLVVDNTFVRHRTEGLEKDVFHRAFKDQMPGRVDLWAPVEKMGGPAAHDWTDPQDLPAETHHTVQLAEAIAAEIKRLIGQPIPEEIGLTGTYRMRPITAGDFLVLVRGRTGLFEEIIRACKSGGLDIAGADVLKLGEELAVRDLLALLNFVALPEDDLALATALKSPLFGWTEQQLFTLAQGRRKGEYLWQRLRERADTPKDTLAILNDLRRQADFLRPFDLLSRTLVRHDGRRNLVARLGAESEDAIDALLARALDYERLAVPSLTGFLAWMAGDDAKVKRQLDDAGNRIRVMTVHGSKGLEAPIVILPDTIKRQDRIRAELLDDAGGIIWKSSRAENRPAAEQDIRAAYDAQQENERRRLLYVAMTRAEKWLIVAAAGDVGTDDESWYGTIKDGLEQTGAAAYQSPTGEGLRYEFGDWGAPVSASESTSNAEPTLIGFSPVPPAPPRPKPVSPSKLGGEKILPGETDEAETEAALLRGSLVHLLLEHLPPVAPAAQRDTGLSLIAGYPGAGALDDTNGILETVLDLISDPSLAHIFASGALCEVDVSATLTALGNVPIYGSVDRLIVEDDRVIVVDYKTNRAVPENPDQVPEGILRQMGAYADAVTQIFPNKRVETAILWVSAKKLMILPGDLVARALGRATAP